MDNPVSNVDVTQTTCPYCGVGCGVLASVSDTEVIEISGDSQHPANAGKLCSKGLALAQTFDDEHRLLEPAIQGKPINWEQATDHIAQTLQATIERYGHESVGFYVSGQLLSEDYYVVNKFVKGWLGTANIDTNSRLCMASSVVGHKRAFGSDTVPGCYEDLDSAELIVLVGSNLAWCHPVIYQRIMANKAKRPTLKVIVVDPRRSITADNADLHLGIKPDADTLLFNALLDYLHRHGKIDQHYVDNHVSGFDQALVSAQQSISDDLAQMLGVAASDLERFFDMFSTTTKTVTIYSQGVNQSRSGTDKVNAIINCHLATGRIGKPGMGPFSITGQPNAMGGREVGGLATMLACHRDLDNEDHQSQVQRFWQSPRIAKKPGLTAIDMFDAVESGEIKALWIMATNPVDSMPEANRIARALAACPFVVVSEVTQRSDTLGYAHVALPAQAFGEKDGTVTNSERRISRQRKFIRPRGQAMPDWWAVSRVAQKMGFGDAFDYQNPAQIFSEYARLSMFENNGLIDFDIGACAHLTESEYNGLQPFQWPRNNTQSPPLDISSKRQENPIRFFAKGNFYTPDRRARMISVNPASPGNNQLSDLYPLILNTGRIRDQWHTMTRTGYNARLMGHRAEPFIELNPGDALIHGIADADIVVVKSPTGSTLARALHSDRQVPGHVFTPMHWSDQFASNARIDTLVASTTDPLSRQPALKNQVVSIQRFSANSYAFLLTRSEPELRNSASIEYWASSPVEGGWRCEIASTLSGEELLDTLLPSTFSNGNDGKLQRIDYRDKQYRRFAWFDNDESLHALLYISPCTVELSRTWATSLLKEPFGSSSKRWQTMAGRATSSQPDKGAIVCSCFTVGDREITRLIKSGDCSSTEAIGQRLGAGTNCGSCRNEIDVLVKLHKTDGKVLSAF
ncbi:MAG: molybdopterin-dependent oxidoreductase [Granulosicoccus sp.]